MTSKLFESPWAQRHIRIDEKYLALINNIYTSPAFYTSLNSRNSSTHHQDRGIRQGCPLSPYLFILCQAVLFHDIHTQLSTDAPQYLWPANFTELFYADDTVLFASSPEYLQKLLHTTEQVAAKYGLSLNRSKCCYIPINAIDHLYYHDGTPVPKTDTTKYLGSTVTHDARVRAELNRRLMLSRVTWDRLKVFWRHSACPLHIKLQLYDMVIRARLVYGLDSFMLLDSHLELLQSFQLKGLRRILHITTTFVNRTNTNATVFQAANNAKPAGSSRIRPIGEYLQDLQNRHLGHIMRANSEDPKRLVTFKPDTYYPNFLPTRRVGRPRHNWIETGLSRTFKIAAHNHATRHLTSTTSYINGRDWYHHEKEQITDTLYKWNPIPPPPIYTHAPPLTLSTARYRKKKFHARPPLGSSFYKPRSPSVSSAHTSDTDPISDSLSDSRLSGEASHSDDSSIYSHTSLDIDNYYHHKLLINAAYNREF